MIRRYKAHSKTNRLQLEGCEEYQIKALSPFLVIQTIMVNKPLFVLLRHENTSSIIEARSIYMEIGGIGFFAQKNEKDLYLFTW